jgi:hypothetical protein
MQGLGDVSERATLGSRQMAVSSEKLEAQAGALPGLASRFRTNLAEAELASTLA